MISGEARNNTERDKRKPCWLADYRAKGVKRTSHLQVSGPTGNNCCKISCRERDNSVEAAVNDVFELNCKLVWSLYDMNRSTSSRDRNEFDFARRVFGDESAT